MKNNVLNVEILEKNSISDLDFEGIEDNLEFYIQDNNGVNLNLFNFETIKEINILNEGADVDFNCIDFALENKKINAKIILFGDSSKVKWSSSVLSTKEDEKLYNVSFSHIGEKSKSIMNNYGVCKDSSKILFDGISHIEKSAKKSEASQNAKVIIYDKNCSAYANPKLLIDYDDVIANHSAAVGTLNEDHIFYLLSRGLSIKEARKLITLGYLKPILNDLDENYKEKYEKLLGDLM